MPVKIVGIIPARFASTRFPGKPLALIAGKPLIQHVIEQCRKAKSLAEVIVATDDSRIADAVKKFCRVEMTRADHPSGSDRIAEVAARCACDAVVNIQGDEPLIDPKVIDAVAGALAQNEMSTAATRIKNPAELDNPNVVKVVVSAAGRALYFSRRTIPYLREGSARASRAVESASLSTHSVDEASTATREGACAPRTVAGARGELAAGRLHHGSIFREQVFEVGRGLDAIAAETDEQKRIGHELVAHIEAISEMTCQNTAEISQTSVAVQELDALA